MNFSSFSRIFAVLFFLCFLDFSHGTAEVEMRGDSIVKILRKVRPTNVDCENPLSPVEYTNQTVEWTKDNVAIVDSEIYKKEGFKLLIRRGSAEETGNYTCTVSSKNQTVFTKKYAVIERICADDKFICDHGRRCLMKEWLCDGVNDCKDASDETQELCKSPCPDSMFTCDDGQRCISKAWVCDGEMDCKDESDEKQDMCPRKNCTKEEFACDDGKRCIPKILLCDDENHCRDGSDEKPGLCKKTCSSDQFVCDDGIQCIPRVFVCDEEEDCDDESDEDPDMCFNPVVKVDINPPMPVKEESGADVKLACRLEAGNPSAMQSVVWSRNGAFYKRQPFCDESTASCNVTASTLLLENVDRTHHGNYSCRGKTMAGWGHYSPATELIVHHPPGPATLVYEPKKVVKNGRVTLRCSVADAGQPKSSAFKWMRGNQTVDNVTTASWSINRANFKSETNFSCSAVNEVGEGEPATVSVAILVMPEVKLDIDPAGPVSEAAHTNVTITCRVEGGKMGTNPRFEFHVADASRLVRGRLPNCSDTSAPTCYVTPDKMLLRNVNRSDQGRYTCKADIVPGQGTADLVVH